MALPSKRNEHPVDRLADLRMEVRALEAQIDELRAHIIETGDVRGDRYLASLQNQKRNALSREKLDRKFGKAAVDACCDVRDMVLVKTTPRK
jgi:hypothetical protein